MESVELNLVSWMREKALPLWISRGLDRIQGGFVEQLNGDGSPSDPGFKRVRVQGRQLFCFSTAALLGWNRDAAAAADMGFHYLKKHCRTKEGLWVRRLKSDGSILDAEMDLYDTAFIVLGLSTYFRLTENPEVFGLMDSTLGLVRQNLSAPGGRGYFQSKSEMGTLRQNPHMHWFEAMLFSFQATGEPRFLEEAQILYRLAKDYFIDPKTGALREVFDGEWKPLPEGEKILVEPGHHYEWAWLLARASKVMEVEPSLGPSILSFADKHGVNPVTGLVYDQVSGQGELTQSTHRLWVQTEALKAWLIREDTDEPPREKRILEIESNLLKYYLTREPLGSWGDRLDAGGKDLGGPVPASSMYHLMVCVTELAAWRAHREKNQPNVKA